MSILKTFLKPIKRLFSPKRKKIKAKAGFILMSEKRFLRPPQRQRVIKIKRTSLKKKKKLKNKIKSPKRLKKIKQKIKKKPVKLTKKQPLKVEGPKGELIGKVTHYFSRIEVVVVKITRHEIKVGDKIHIKGKNTDFTQKVQSLQVESVDVTSARKGTLVGLKVVRVAKEGDQVFKI